MTKAIYPGSFNPWHMGHQDILLKATQCFDKVIIVQMQNPEKKAGVELQFDQGVIDPEKVRYIYTTDPTLKSIVDQIKPDAIVRGLRNGHDLQYEMNQQYWNEDVGIEIPFVYFVADRALSHVSSSAIKMVDGLGLKHDYTN